MEVLQVVFDNGVLVDFVEQLALKKSNDELFEVWLHKCFDEQTFDEWKTQMQVNAGIQPKTSQVETKEQKTSKAVAGSLAILNKCIPPEES